MLSLFNEREICTVGGSEMGEQVQVLMKIVVLESLENDYQSGKREKEIQRNLPRDRNECESC